MTIKKFKPCPMPQASSRPFDRPEWLPAKPMTDSNIRNALPVLLTLVTFLVLGFGLGFATAIWITPAVNITSMF